MTAPSGRGLYLLREPPPDWEHNRQRYRPDAVGARRRVVDRQLTERAARDRYSRDRRVAVRHVPAVYWRRRVAALAAVTVVAVGVWLAAGRLGGRGPVTAPVAGRFTAGRVWVVRPGDTLWGIALASGDRGDIRPLVDRLSAEVHGQPLQVGEQITLP